MSCSVCRSSDKYCDQLPHDVHDLRERVAKLEALAGASLRHMVTAPLASGQLASAGAASVPNGWKLAPGWSWSKTYAHGGICDNCTDGPGIVIEQLGYGKIHRICRAHAITLGALVRDEPSAERKCPSCFRALGEGPCSVCWAAAPYDILPEQPSRQETGGGETACKSWCGKPGRSVPVGEWGRRIHDEWYCTAACLDRAKAKAAEQEKCTTCGAPNCFFHAGRAPLPQPSEPSGTGQLPSAPVVSRSVQRRMRAQQNLDIVTGEPIAEPPAPAAGTLSDAINALPEQVRRYVHDIETNCDPAGTVRDNVLLRDQLAALEARLSQAERERDEWHAKYESQRQEVLRWQDREEELLVLRRERNEAAAKERERCVAWVRHFNPMPTAVDHAIKSGKPAPGTD